MFLGIAMIELDGGPGARVGFGQRFDSFRRTIAFGGHPNVCGCDGFKSLNVGTRHLNPGF